MGVCLQSPVFRGAEKKTPPWGPPKFLTTPEKENKGGNAQEGKNTVMATRGNFPEEKKPEEL